MADERQRELERRYRNGDVKAGGEWLISRLRSGDLTPYALLAAAMLGDPAAEAARDYVKKEVDLGGGVYYTASDLSPITLRAGTVDMRQEWSINTDAGDVMSVDIGLKALGGVWNVRHARVRALGKIALIVEADYAGSLPEASQHPTRCAEGGHEWSPNWVVEDATRIGARRCGRVGCHAVLTANFPLHHVEGVI